MGSQLVDLTTSTTAGADGRAVVRFTGPGVSQDVLHVDAISLASTSALLPSVILYRGEPGSGRRLSANPDGRSGWFQGGAAADVITAGDLWSVEWSGCTPGAACSAALTGSIRRRGT